MAIAHSDIERLHERISELREALAKVENHVGQWASACTACGKIVWGNGTDPIDRRVTKLEERSATLNRMVGLGLTAAGVLGAIAGPLMGAMIRAMFGS